MSVSNVCFKPLSLWNPTDWSMVMQLQYNIYQCMKIIPNRRRIEMVDVALLWGKLLPRRPEMYCRNLRPSVRPYELACPLDNWKEIFQIFPKLGWNTLLIKKSPTRSCVLQLVIYAHGSDSDFLYLWNVSIWWRHHVSFASFIPLVTCSHTAVPLVAPYRSVVYGKDFMTIKNIVFNSTCYIAILISIVGYT